MLSWETTLIHEFKLQRSFVIISLPFISDLILYDMIIFYVVFYISDILSLDVWFKIPASLVLSGQSYSLSKFNCGPIS